MALLPALIGTLDAGDLAKAVSRLPAAVYKEQGQPGSGPRGQILSRFLRSARSKKVGWPSVTAKSSCVAATRSSR